MFNALGVIITIKTLIIFSSSNSIYIIYIIYDKSMHQIILIAMMIYGL